MNSIFNSQIGTLSKDMLELADGHKLDILGRIDFENIIPSPTISPQRKEKTCKAKDRKTVAVEGNIGCGKTTFLNYFRKYKNVEILAEPVAMWTDVMGYNALDLMYKDSHRWSCAFQSLVTLSMLDHHQPSKTAHNVKMIERSVYSARHCFIENLKQSGVLSSMDHAILTEWHSWMDENENIDIDLIVYLRASPEVCAERMKQRNRTEECGVPLDYLKSLHNLHDDWLLHNKRGQLPAPVLVLDANKDLTKLQEDIAGLSQDILCGLTAA